MSRKIYFILFILFFVEQHVSAQRSVKKIKDINRYESAVEEGFENYLIFGDTIYIMLSICKDNWMIKKEVPQLAIVVAEPIIEKETFLKIHGNILYNFSYRSYIDTPFAQNDLQQHLVQTNLNFIVKEKYPVQMTITNRSSNSPYFKNLTDVNLNFNRKILLDKIKSDIKTKAIGLLNKDALTKTEASLRNKEKIAQELQTWLNSPARAQEFVEEKEQMLRGDFKTKLDLKKLDTNLDLKNIENEGLENFNFPKEKNGVQKIAISKIKNSIPDSLLNRFDKVKKNQKVDFASIESNNKDSVKNKISNTKSELINTVSKSLSKKDSSRIEKFNVKKNQLLKLKEEIKKEEKKLMSLRKNILDSVNKIKRDIASLNNPSSLFAFMKEKGIPKSDLTKAQKILLSINQLGIGRAYVDYSELTVKNISLAGVNVEMNPNKFYFAAAAGKVNYRFRDFIVKNNSLPSQSLFMVRAGIGSKEKNNFIVSVYTGKKDVLNYSAAYSNGNLQNVFGISAETRLAINENNYIVAEVAKSSYNENYIVPQNTSQLVGKATNLNIHTNEAYSIKLFSQFPKTNTKVSGYFKKIGENFQSFNLAPTNINQDAWLAKVSQILWKKRLVVDASVRKNDFISPIATPITYTSSTIFKSIQASLRIPKYPFISVGYYPSSQLSLTDNNVLTENQYNTFNSIMNYSYQFKKTGMNTNAVYTKFYNNSSDTSFIYYNASSFTLNHSVYLDKFNLQSSVSITDQKDLNILSLEQLVGYQFKNSFSLSGSLKWNRLNKIENLLGASAIMSMNLNKIGTLQFNYEKTYLPSYNRKLIPVDIGRMSFYRQF